MAEAKTKPGLVERYRQLSRLGVPAGYPLAQFPNAPLWVAIAAWVAQRLVSGNAADYAAAVGFVGIVVWAWLELFDGVNLFRRALGAVVLVSTVISLADRLA